MLHDNGSSLKVRDQEKARHIDTVSYNVCTENTTGPASFKLITKETLHLCHVARWRQLCLVEDLLHIFSSGRRVHQESANAIKKPGSL